MTTSNSILKHQMISAEEVMNIKVVELIKIYNFHFGHFFIWQSDTKYCSQMTYLLYSFINYTRDMFMNNVYYHFVRWRNDQNKSCRSWCVIQLWYSSLFQLKSFNGWKSHSNLSFFLIWSAQTLSNEKKWQFQTWFSNTK